MHDHYYKESILIVQIQLWLSDILGWLDVICDDPPFFPLSTCLCINDMVILTNNQS